MWDKIDDEARMLIGIGAIENKLREAYSKNPRGDRLARILMVEHELEEICWYFQELRVLRVETVSYTHLTLPTSDLV